MNEIICPHCNKAFKIDEAGYADILKQVRDHAFEEQLQERLSLAEKDKENAVALAKEKAIGEMQRAASTKDAEIQELKSKLEAGAVSQKLAITEALNVVEKERDSLLNDLQQAKRENESATKLIEARLNQEIQELKSKLEATDVSKTLAITQAVSVVEKERDQLQHKLSQAELEIRPRSVLSRINTKLKSKTAMMPSNACGI